MVQPPYWVAARIYGAAAPSIGASSVAHARISGSYTLHTGKDLDDLPPHLYLDVVESWTWERFTKQDQVDQWQSALNAPPVIDVADDWTQIGLVEAARTVEEFLATFDGETVTEPQEPAGWDNALLVAQQRVDGIVFD